MYNFLRKEYKGIFALILFGAYLSDNNLSTLILATYFMLSQDIMDLKNEDIKHE